MTRLFTFLGLFTSHALCIALGYGMGAFAALVRPIPASELPPFGGAEATAASGVGGPSNLPSFGQQWAATDGLVPATGANLVVLEPMDREWLEANVPFMGAN